MTRLLLVCGFLLAFAPSADANDGAPHAMVRTSLGAFEIALDPRAAPKTVENFVAYATSGHYDRTIIHRVVPGYVIQGGGYSKYFNERPTRAPIPYEGDNGLRAPTVVRPRRLAPLSSARPVKDCNWTSHMSKVPSENSGDPYPLQDCETGRIGIARQVNPETQNLKILFWVPDEMVAEAAAKIMARKTDT